MRSVTYVIDPRGDIEVVLAAPKPIPRRSLPNGRCSSSPMTGEEDDEEEEDDSTTKMGTLDSLFYGTTNPQEKDREVEIRMRVSSYHLSLASPVLSTQLEVSRLQPTTRAARPANAIHLTGWDVKALATVLNIIHGQRSQVLRNVDFGFVTHIAVAAHHLKCVEAVQLYSEMWLSSFRTDKIPYFNNACLMWLFNSSVFSWENEFSHCAQLVLSEYKGPGTVTLHDLPLAEVLGWYSHQTYHDPQLSIVR
ncbi:hypothetical protein FOQG_03553 [Fusarium oxysporum f. sp. raphani 54005]|uniref:BTB domain-containing protein n=1 Tax=Fusarium oxysporum f. sp. raphani 54005 TaxID=1089458 RepID=X0D0A3_FUSOX|nr:hypothetical protein FOQG_03553 [Fusarium oxysporum f. sp. raphani 54005]